MGEAQTPQANSGQNQATKAILGTLLKNMADSGYQKAGDLAFKVRDLEDKFKRLDDAVRRLQNAIMLKQSKNESLFLKGKQRKDDSGKNAT